MKLAKWHLQLSSETRNQVLKTREEVLKVGKKAADNVGCQSSVFVYLASNLINPAPKTTQKSRAQFFRKNDE